MEVVSAPRPASSQTTAGPLGDQNSSKGKKEGEATYDKLLSESEVPLYKGTTTPSILSEHLRVISPMVKYRVVQLDFKGRPKGILCHDPDRPCALTAIYNCLHLMHEEETMTPGRTMDEKKAKEKIRRRLLYYMGKVSETQLYPEKELDKVRAESRMEIEKLPSKPEIIPLIGSCSMFKPTNARRMFEYLNIKLIHGWVLDPRDEIYAEVREFCHDELADYDGPAEKIQQLLVASKNEATSFGYNFLPQYVEPGALHVLYWDGKFAVIHEHYGSLLKLETNKEFIHANRGVHWTVLNENEEDRFYLNAQYVPVPNQPNFTKAMEWYREKQNAKAVQDASSRVKYKVVQLDFEGKPKGILCHGPKGPCALTAIYNCLHLMGNEESKSPGQMMDERQIKDYIQKCLLVNINTLAGNKLFPQALLDYSRTTARIEIDRLPSQPELVPIIGSCRMFKSTSAIEMFYILNTKLVHGWVLDPQDEIYERVSGFCHDELAAYDGTSEKIQQLLGASKNEATSFGYNNLSEYVEAGAFHILYWDGKFNVVHKHKGSLLVLETDAEFLDANPNVAWRVLNEMEEYKFYLNAQYAPVANQPNFPKAKAWYEKLDKAEAVEAASSGVMPMGPYYYMGIRFKGMPKSILCHELGGSCVLTALHNCVNLKYSHSCPVLPNQSITEHLIKERLNIVLSRNISILLESGSYTNEELNEKKTECEALIDSLPCSLGILPLLESYKVFKETDGLLLFEYLRVPLVHGWLVDPNMAIYENVKGLSHDELELFLNLNQVEDDAAADVNNLLQAKNNIATAYGFHNLHKNLDNGEFAVLYWNDKFSVIYKHLGSILILETDKAFLDTYPEAIWRVLDMDLQNDKIYLNQVFYPADKQPCLDKAITWHGNTMSSAFNVFAGNKKYMEATSKEPIEWHRTHATRNNRKRAAQGVSIDAAQLTDESMVSSSAAATSEAEITREHLSGKSIVHHPSTGDSPSATAIGEVEQLKEHSSVLYVAHHPCNLGDSSKPATMGEVDKPKEHSIGDLPVDFSISSDFLQFLLKFEDGSSEIGCPYFEGELASMKARKSSKFYVPFDFIKRYDLSLAIKIQNHHARIYDELVAAVCSYLLERKFEFVHIELEIHHLPEPNSIQSFEDFVKCINLVEEYDVYGDGFDHSTSYDGRNMALGFLNFLVQKFKIGRCLAGNWSEIDMMVSNNGKNYDIICEDEDLTVDGASADLLKFCNTVLLRFRKNGRLPPYFEQFLDDCLHIPDFKNQPVEWERFLMLMSAPLALKAPLVRSAFICNVYEVADSMRSGTPFVFTPLHQRIDLLDWRDVARRHFYLQKIHDYNNFPSSSASGSVLNRWGCTYWSLFQYSRHFIQHVLKYTKKDQVQMVRDLAIVDMMLARQLEKYIAKSIGFLVFNCDMDLFSAPWRHYLASECYDREHKDVDKEIKRQEETRSGVGLVECHSCPQIDETEMAKAELLVGIVDKATSNLSHTSRLVGDANLEYFVNHLSANGTEVCPGRNGGLLCCGSIHVFKTTDKTSNVTLLGISGPICTAYYDIVSLLSAWLNL